MAINGKYNVTIDTPMGSGTGTCTFKSEGNNLSGDFETQFGNLKFTGTCNGENAKFTGTMPSPMGGMLNLTFNLQVTPADLSGTIDLGGYGTAPIKGKKA
ncbi:MAG: hypothetical protein PHE50_04985 [Dehalococcoidales bacterium]|nr:hypothetical protein [Dehalococcoidales bacterium]